MCTEILLTPFIDADLAEVMAAAGLDDLCRRRARGDQADTLQGGELPMQHLWRGTRF